MHILMLTVVFFCAFFVLYPYLIYPFLLKMLSQKKFRMPKGERSQLRYALLFCAHNEEKALPATIETLRRVKSLWPELKILAYSDCSKDRTVDILRSAEDILMVFEGKERLGKPAGMARLVSSTDADVVIFMDANVLLEPSTVRHFENYFSHSDVGAVAGTLRYINGGVSAVASIGGLYWQLEEKIKQLETDTGSTMGADGSLFAMRREFYPVVRNDLQDDFLASMEVVFHGLRCVSAPDIYAYEAASVGSRAEFRRKRRIACGAFSSHRHIWSRVRMLQPIDLFKYVSHKLIRWFGVFFLIVGYLSAWILAFHLELGLMFAVFFAAKVAVFATAIRLGVQPVIKVYEILAAIVATGVGVVESMVGTKYAIWKPTER